MIESQLNKIMCYFKDWRKDREERKGKRHLHQLESKEWQKSFVSPQSYLNWRMGICGFVQCWRIACKIQNKLGKPLSYIHILHSNASTLEACLSLVRSCEGHTIEVSWNCTNN